MKVLFIGGTGIISSASSELAVARGIDLYHLNRGITSIVRNVQGVKTLTADIRDQSATEKVLGSEKFDVVVNWIGFEPEHVSQDIRLFSGKVKQYIYISSASVYQTPPEKLPITEKTPLSNPFWAYSRNKIACERVLEEAHEKSGFPFTIIRPSHTYDKTLIPLIGGVTALHRMRSGLPVLVHGDGSSIWTLTHHKDFAKGLIGLLCQSGAIGEAYHITNNELLSWNQIYWTLAEKLGIEPRLVHVPSHVIGRYDEDLAGSLLGDKTHSMIFDNTKIRSIVPDFKPCIPFEQGAKEIIDYYVNGNNYLQLNPKWNTLLEKIIAENS